MAGDELPCEVTEDVPAPLRHLHRIAATVYPLRHLEGLFRAVQEGRLPAEWAACAQVTHQEGCPLWLAVVFNEFQSECNCTPTIHARLSNVGLFVEKDGSLNPMTQH
jgi:hypothetical protein